MAIVKNVVGGSYTVLGPVRFYTLTIALTANTTVIAGGRQGDLVKTTNATGRMSLYVLDSGLKVQYLTNA